MKTFMLVVAALVIVSMTAIAGSGVTSPLLFGSTVAVTPLAVTGGGADLANVSAGVTYTVVADILLAGGPIAVTPNDLTNPIWTPTETLITAGDPLAAVLVTHYLPNALFGLVGGPPIGYSTIATSGAWGIAGAETNFFDPAVPTVMYLDATGAGMGICYGGIWSVPVNAVPDVYSGNGLVVVEYTGAQ